VIGPRRNEGASRDDVTEEATTPRAKDGPSHRAEALLDCAGVAHRFHTPDMRALRSLARSTLVSANCTGYFLMDPYLRSGTSLVLDSFLAGLFGQ